MDNGWSEWRLHIREELKRFSKALEDQSKTLKELSDQILILKVKASMWGVFGGLVGYVAVSLLT